MDFVLCCSCSGKDPRIGMWLRLEVQENIDAQGLGENAVDRV